MEPAELGDCDGPPGGRGVWLRTDDAVRIRVGSWPVPAGGRGTVLVAPGRTECIEKYGVVAAALARGGWGALVIDWRGQGLADRSAPDRLIGDVADFAGYQADLRAVLGFAAARGLGPMPWLAHSMGGCIALRALCDGLSPPAVAFSAPMWGLSQSPAMVLAIATLARLARPFGRDRGYVATTGPDYGLPGMAWELNPLTRDRAMFERMKRQIAADPRLALGGPSLRWSGAALAEMARLATQPSPAVQVLVALGGAESVVSPDAIRDRMARWPGGELVEYPGAAHELLMELPEVRDDLMARALALFVRTSHG